MSKQKHMSKWDWTRSLNFITSLSSIVNLIEDTNVTIQEERKFSIHWIRLSYELQGFLKKMGYAHDLDSLTTTLCFLIACLIS